MIDRCQSEFGDFIKRKSKPKMEVKSAISISTPYVYYPSTEWYRTREEKRIRERSLVWIQRPDGFGTITTSKKWGKKKKRGLIDSIMSYRR